MTTKIKALKHLWGEKGSGGGGDEYFNPTLMGQFYQNKTKPIKVPGRTEMSKFKKKRAGEGGILSLKSRGG